MSFVTPDNPKDISLEKAERMGAYAALEHYDLYNMDYMGDKSYVGKPPWRVPTKNYTGPPFERKGDFPYTEHEGDCTSAWRKGYQNMWRKIHAQKLKEAGDLGFIVFPPKRGQLDSDFDVLMQGEPVRILSYDAEIPGDKQPEVPVLEVEFVHKNLNMYLRYRSVWPERRRGNRRRA